MSFAAHLRARLVLGAAVCLLVLFGLIAVLRADSSGLSRVDRIMGTKAELVSFAHPALVQVLLGIELTFSDIPMAVATVVTAALLFQRRHTRAGVWTLVVMVGAALTTTLLKLALRRHRPVWQHPVHTLRSYSFPSGHSSAIAAAAGVAIVLAVLLLRRRSWRRTVTAVALVLVLVVGLDRVFLGVHNPSDVLAGYAVGGIWVLGGAVLFDPASRPRRRAGIVRPAPGTRQVAVVLNPAKIEDLDGFRAGVEHQVERAGWDPPSWLETTVEDPGRAMAEEAAIAGAELVLVVGGDGTVRTVCAELAGTGIPVGIVPAGTGNLLARNLGIPLHLHAAVETALDGRDRTIDLVKIDGDGVEPEQHFLVMAGMGFDAAVMEAASERTKARVGWLAYVVAAFRNLMYPAVRLEVSADGGEWTTHRARTALIGNVGFLQAGMPLLPDAAMDDGTLDLVLLNPRGFWAWLPLAARVLSRGRRTDDALVRMTGRTLSIRAAHDVPRQVDGDPIGAGRELHAECIHGRLLVRVPR